MIHTLLADWDEERSLSREEAVEILDLPKEEMEEQNIKGKRSAYSC